VPERDDVVNSETLTEPIKVVFGGLKGRMASEAT
jgi:hypothetical protein